MSIAAINDMFKETSTKLKGVLQLRDLVVNAHNLAENDKTFEFLDKFEADVKEAVKNSEEKIQKIDETYKELAVYFVENPKDFTIEVFFEIFIKFCTALAVRLILCYL